MCDYSLMSVPNRLARDGEELVTHRFQTGTIGLASASDLHRNADPTPPASRTFWSALGETFSPREVCRAPAVCIPPGARLLLQDIPENLQRELNIGACETVTFTQITADAHRYRDSVRFGNGREILLQRLSEGLRVRVLALGSEAVSDTPKVAEQMILR
jgi:hypothetical protein